MKYVVLVIAAIASVTAVAACTSSSGTHTQSLSPTTPTSSTQSTLSATTPTGPTMSTEPTTSPPRTSTASSPSTITPPSVVPAAQSAVNSYIAFVNLSVVSAADPKHANLSAFSKYVTGGALKEIKSGFQQMAKDGYAYRGTPPKPRLKVTVSETSVVVLSDCGSESTTRPYVEYSVKTGKAIPQPTQSPPPPYLHVITMHFVGGLWKLASIDVDSSKTCIP